MSDPQVPRPCPACASTKSRVIQGKIGMDVHCLECELVAPIDVWCETRSDVEIEDIRPQVKIVGPPTPHVAMLDKDALMRSVVEKLSPEVERLITDIVEDALERRTVMNSNEGFKGACPTCEPVGELNVKLEEDNIEMRAILIAVGATTHRSKLLRDWYEKERGI